MAPPGAVPTMMRMIPLCANGSAVASASSAVRQAASATVRFIGFSLCGPGPGRRPDSGNFLSQPVAYERRGRNPQNCDRDHRRRATPVVPLKHDTGAGKGDCVMTRTSDHTGVLVYSLLVTLLVLATIYVPA